MQMLCYKTQPSVQSGLRSRPFVGPLSTAPIVRGQQKARVPVCKASNSEELGVPATAGIALGLVANPIILWSSYTLYTTGAGLPEGPGGALGAAEGVSYLVILGIIAWSIYTKVKTGTGLPSGPAGLLGAVEGLSYLSLLAAVAAFALKAQ